MPARARARTARGRRSTRSPSAGTGRDGRSLVVSRLAGSSVARAGRTARERFASRRAACAAAAELLRPRADRLRGLPPQAACAASLRPRFAASPPRAASAASPTRRGFAPGAIALIAGRFPHGLRSDDRRLGLRLDPSARAGASVFAAWFRPRRSSPRPALATRWCDRGVAPIHPRLAILGASSRLSPGLLSRRDLPRRRGCGPGAPARTRDRRRAA